jgi:hypothetical protein
LTTLAATQALGRAYQPKLDAAMAETRTGLAASRAKEAIEAASAAQEAKEAKQDDSKVSPV